MEKTIKVKTYKNGKLVFSGVTLPEEIARLEDKGFKVEIIGETKEWRSFIESKKKSEKVKIEAEKKAKAKAKLKPKTMEKTINVEIFKNKKKVNQGAILPSEKKRLESKGFEVKEVKVLVKEAKKTIKTKEEKAVRQTKTVGTIKAK